jgi:hypothetical protein
MEAVAGALEGSRSRLGRSEGFRKHTRLRVSGGMPRRSALTIGWSLAQLRGRVVIRMAVPSTLKEQCKALKLGPGFEALAN